MNLKFHSVLDDVDDAWPGRRAGVLLLWGSPFRARATPGVEGHPIPEHDVVELPSNAAQAAANATTPNATAGASPVANASITGRMPVSPTPATPADDSSAPAAQSTQATVELPAQPPAPQAAPATPQSPIEVVPETHVDPLLDPRPYGEEAVHFFVQHWMENRPKSDSIVISGEEPLQQGVALIPLCKELKDEGFSIKLDTRGFYPEKLSDLLPYLDYVSIEVPTRFDSAVYSAALRFDGDKEIPVSNALRSFVFMENWNDPGTREAKTIVIPHRNANPADIASIAEAVGPSVDQYALQSYDPILSLLSPPVGQPIEMAELAELARIAKEKVKRVVVRMPGQEAFI